MISVIIPIYIISSKLYEVVGRCIQSLEMTTTLPYELITVNDASPYPFSATITHKKNLGYAQSVNDGLKKAQGDILIIANDDLEFIEGWESALLSEVTNESVGITSLPTSDEEIVLTGGLVEDAKFGSLWAMRRDVLEKVGYLDEDFPHYFNDTEYYMRVKKHGYRVIKNTSIVIPHVGKATYSIVDPNDNKYHEALEKYKEKFGRVD